MAFTSGEKEEIRQIVEMHVSPVVEKVNSATEEQTSDRKIVETLAKAMERLSLVVVGDEELKIVGHARKIELIEIRMQIAEQNRTKVVWFVLGAVLVINLIFRLMPWEFVMKIFLPSA